jgi:hypothetical protein
MASVALFMLLVALISVFIGIAAIGLTWRRMHGKKLGDKTEIRPTTREMKDSETPSVLRFIKVVFLCHRIVEVNKSIRFPSAVPVPAARLVVVGLLLLTSTVLSPSLILERIGLDFGTTPDFCTDVDLNAATVQFRSEIYEATSYLEAVDHEREVRDTLTNALSDTGDYFCVEIEVGNAGVQRKSGASAAAVKFPDWCAEALDTAIDSARSRTCRRRYCKWGFSIFGLNCVTVQVPCAPPGLDGFFSLQKKTKKKTGKNRKKQKKTEKNRKKQKKATETR